MHINNQIIVFCYLIYIYSVSLKNNAHSDALIRVLIHSVLSSLDSIVTEISNYSFLLSELLSLNLCIKCTVLHCQETEVILIQVLSGLCYKMSVIDTNDTTFQSLYYITKIVKMLSLFTQGHLIVFNKNIVLYPKHIHLVHFLKQLLTPLPLFWD